MLTLKQFHAQLAEGRLAGARHIQLSDALTEFPPALYALLACVYSLGFERSHWQATPGKRVLGLQVVRVDGGAMTLGTAMQRFLAAGLSWISSSSSMFVWSFFAKR